jgi:hypothetical protein
MIGDAGSVAPASDAREGEVRGRYRLRAGLSHHKLLKRDLREPYWQGQVAPRQLMASHPRDVEGRVAWYGDAPFLHRFNSPC